MEEKIYYYSDGENNYGPFSKSDLINYHDTGYILDETWVWNTSNESWINYNDLVASNPTDESPILVKDQNEDMFSFSCKFHKDRDPVTICTECGANICAECSVKKGSVVYCPECAVSSTGDEYVASPIPGKEKHPDEVKTTELQKPPKKNKKKSKAKVYIILAVILILVLGIIGGSVYYFLFSKEKPKETYTKKEFKIQVTH